MELVLENVIDIEVKSGSGVEKLQVAYRYPTKEEEKEIDDLEKQLKGIVRKILKLQKDIETIDKRIEYAEKQENYKKAEKLLDEKEKLEKEMEKLAQEIDAMGGDNIVEAVNKKAFDLLVGGKDAERLRDIAETIGYARVMEKLNSARAELEGEHR